MGGDNMGGGYSEESMYRKHQESLADAERLRVEAQKSGDKLNLQNAISKITEASAISNENAEKQKMPVLNIEKKTLTELLLDAKKKHLTPAEMAAYQLDGVAGDGSQNYANAFITAYKNCTDTFGQDETICKFLDKLTTNKSFYKKESGILKDFIDLGYTKSLRKLLDLAKVHEAQGEVFKDIELLSRCMDKNFKNDNIRGFLVLTSGSLASENLQENYDIKSKFLFGEDINKSALGKIMSQKAPPKELRMVTNLMLKLCKRYKAEGHLVGLKLHNDYSYPKLSDFGPNYYSSGKWNGVKNEIIGMTTKYNEKLAAGIKNSVYERKNQGVELLGFSEKISRFFSNMFK